MEVMRVTKVQKGENKTITIDTRGKKRDIGKRVDFEPKEQDEGATLFSKCRKR